MEEGEVLGTRKEKACPCYGGDAGEGCLGSGGLNLLQKLIVTI